MATQLSAEVSHDAPVADGGALVVAVRGGGWGLSDTCYSDVVRQLHGARGLVQVLDVGRTRRPWPRAGTPHLAQLAGYLLLGSEAEVRCRCQSLHSLYTMQHSPILLLSFLHLNR